MAGGDRSGRRLAGAGLLAGAVAGGVAWEARQRRRLRELAGTAAPLDRPEGRPSVVSSADGTEIHVEVFGSKERPTLVLAHGWTCSLELWHHQIESLAPEFRVVAYDLRGHGRSGRSTDRDYSIEAFASDLDAVLRASLPEGEKAILAGHSMGAMTIVALAGERPETLRERVAAAALLNTGVGDLVTEALVLRTPTALSSVRTAIGGTLLCSQAPLTLPEPLLLRLTRSVALSPDASDEAVELTAAMVRRCHPAVRGGCGTSISQLDLYEAVASLEVPTLVIAGELDKLTPPALSRKLAEALPEPLGLVEVPGVGHMSPLEAPEEISERLREVAAQAESLPTASAAAARV